MLTDREPGLVYSGQIDSLPQSGVARNFIGYRFKLGGADG
jgi:hypothetical protein